MTDRERLRALLQSLIDSIDQSDGMYRFIWETPGGPQPGETVHFLLSLYPRGAPADAERFERAVAAIQAIMLQPTPM